MLSSSLDSIVSTSLPSLSQLTTHPTLFLLLFFRRVRFDKQDWEAYAHFDASRHYTRNLIATDHVSYTLLLLCWNPGQESPIHDHPCDGW
jgi:hypothetical protein